MVADVTQIGSGGRLYKDAREKDNPPPKNAPKNAPTTKSGREKAREKERATKSEATVKAFLKRAEANLGAALAGEDSSPLDDRPLPPAPPPWVVKPHYEEPEPKRDWAELQSTLLEVTGVAAASIGFGMMYLPLGVVVLGVCLLVMGFVLGLPDGFTFRRRR